MLTLFVILCVCGNPEDLVKQLGNEDFMAREKAHAKLMRSMDFSLYAKLREARTDDPEVSGRISLILSGFEEKIYKKLRPKITIDLMGYPKYPWICEGLPAYYQWRGLRRFEIYGRYQNYAVDLGKPAYNSPDFPSQRKATDLWMTDRINLDFKDAMLSAKTEDEVNWKMEKCMELIRKDMKTMIGAEDRWWQSQGRKNPLRIINGKKK